MNIMDQIMRIFLDGHVVSPYEVLKNASGTCWN